MPLQNRVTPEGTIITVAARGTMMGNRGGCFHTTERQLASRPYASRQWISCKLSFKNRHRNVMSPRRYTELFFLDEATALAAGHRPCFECRRADAVRFADVWRIRTNAPRPPTAPEMDAILHHDRITPGTHQQRTHVSGPCGVPDLTFVRHAGEPHIIWHKALRRWTPGGYDPAAIPIPDHPLVILTPATVVAQLASGYAASHHPSLT